MHEDGITLKDTRPPIWRRIETQGVTLEKSHELTQTAMGWTNSYLHQFAMGGTRYTDPRFREWNGPLDPTEFDVKHATRRNEGRSAGMLEKTTKEGTKKPRERGKANRFPLIEKALGKRTKAELIEIVMKVAKSHAAVARELEDQLGIEKPVDLLVADVSSAIDRATDFDEREINHNLDVDWQAYANARKGLQKLVDLGHLDDAMSLGVGPVRVIWRYDPIVFTGLTPASYRLENYQRIAQSLRADSGSHPIAYPNRPTGRVCFVSTRGSAAHRAPRPP